MLTGVQARPARPNPSSTGLVRLLIQVEANLNSLAEAIKKLQCTLADFRRLCILKGELPACGKSCADLCRHLPSRTSKPQKGQQGLNEADFILLRQRYTGELVFYRHYEADDEQYLLHEPVLQKLREHKTFAKKLSKALGRNNYSLAKSLEQDKPVYRIDHIIKERYPTFADALRDLDDALSLVVLFANLPANPHVPAAILANCARLATEWQYYVMRTKALRKVFLSIKGIYFQAEVKGQLITWLVPYQFTQHVPSDIDFRIMLTFLELYQTLLGFTFYRLFTELNLVYPTKVSPENVLGLGSLLTEETSRTLTIEGEKEAEKWRPQGRQPTAKDVKRQIRQLAAQAAANPPEAASTSALPEDIEVADKMQEVVPGANGETTEAAEEPALFAPYHFYLSREVTRPTLEFVIRSFGGASVSWDAVLGDGSPMTIDDPRITHMIVDRPLIDQPAYPGKRALVQPQWVIDCANAGRLLPTGPYAPGATLPPHLSPFVDAKEGGYVPMEAGGEAPELGSESENEVEEVYDDEEEFAGFGGEQVCPCLCCGCPFYAQTNAQSDEEMAEVEEETVDATPALTAALANPTDEALVNAAELEAEASGMPHADFEVAIANARKSRSKASKSKVSATNEEQLTAGAMLTGKRRKLYEQLKRRQAIEQAEREAMEKKQRKALRAAAR